jgi:hypothetical protein
MSSMLPAWAPSGALLDRHDDRAPILGGTALRHNAGAILFRATDTHNRRHSQRPKKTASFAVSNENPLRSKSTTRNRRRRCGRFMPMPAVANSKMKWPIGKTTFD